MTTNLMKFLGEPPAWVRNWKWRIAAVTIWGPLVGPVILAHIRPILGVLFILGATVVAIKAIWESLPNAAKKGFWDI